MTTDPAKPPTEPNGRPAATTGFGRWLRRFENPTAGDLVIVVGLIPVLALLVVVIVAWLFS